MRLRIVAKPPHPKMLMSGQDVRVENADTGELVEGVMSVEFKCTGRKQPATVTLVIGNVHVDLELGQLSDSEAGLIRLAQTKAE